MDFTDEQLERYSRHIILKEVGIEGQMKLLSSRILIIGAGGLGSPAALYLAAAGVGTIGIADADDVDLSNLQRQVIHFTADVGTPKVDSARNKMRAINPDIEVLTYRAFLRADTIRAVVRDYDFIIDGTDSFASKFLINDACFFEKKPFSHGGILKFDGQTMTVDPGATACVRCVFNAPPPAGSVPSCGQAGVLGAIAGMLGTIQATEAIKFVTGIGEPLTNALLAFDAFRMSFQKIRINRNPRCPLCGTRPSITSLINEEQPACSLQRGVDEGGCA